MEGELVREAGFHGAREPDRVRVRGLADAAGESGGSESSSREREQAGIAYGEAAHRRREGLGQWCRRMRESGLRELASSAGAHDRHAARSVTSGCRGGAPSS